MESVIDSEEDDCYSNDYEEEDDDYKLVEEETDEDLVNLTSRQQQRKYRVLKEADIRVCQEDDITTVSTVLSTSRIDASILLRHYNWSVSRVHDAWFSDEHRVRESVGLLEKPVVKLSNVRELITCAICFESCTVDKFASVIRFVGSAGEVILAHPLMMVLNVMLRCPDPSCPVAVVEDMINLLASHEDNKYSRFLLKSYVEGNRNFKWCPAPGCEYAIDYAAGRTGSNSDVSCLCSYSFCWNCTEETHRPVDCDTVSKWILKNSGSHAIWVQKNTKPCPKCNRAIEKNQGCMHMTCPYPCEFDFFCWLCLCDWYSHHTPLICNRYEAKVEMKIENDKKSFEKYKHYYDRWTNNQSSRQKALADLHQMQTVQLDKLSKIQCQPESQLKFIIDAWVQIVECRRVLKWSYAYGYYLPEKEVAKRQFFEYLQGEAESGLERLHHCAEKELEQFLNRISSPSKEFNVFREKLAGLTNVTKNYFENLVRALENGLADVDSHAPTSSKTTVSTKVREAGKGKCRWKKGKGSRRTGAFLDSGRYSRTTN